MNPHKIFQAVNDEALAKQISSEKYETFVAMPFRNQFSYNADQVFQDVICKAVEIANKESPKREFAPPLRADRVAPNATEITDDIVEGILNCHFFIADFTLANQGVLVEAGVALALKPARHLIFLIQGDRDSIHFDIKDNRFISYDKKNAIKEIAKALIFAAECFEKAIGEHMKSIRESLSPQAVYLLNLYGRLQLKNTDNSLHFGKVQQDANIGNNEGIRRLVFDGAIQELLSKKNLFILITQLQMMV